MNVFYFFADAYILILQSFKNRYIVFIILRHPCFLGMDIEQSKENIPKSLYFLISIKNHEEDL